MPWPWPAKKEEHEAAPEDADASEDDEDAAGQAADDADSGDDALLVIRPRKNHEDFVLEKDMDPGGDLEFHSVGTCPIKGCVWKKLKPHNCWSWRGENYCRSYLCRHLHISGQEGHGLDEEQCIVIAMEAEILKRTYTYEAREQQRTKKRKDEEDWYKDQERKRRKQEGMNAAPTTPTRPATYVAPYAVQHVPKPPLQPPPGAWPSGGSMQPPAPRAGPVREGASSSGGTQQQVTARFWILRCAYFALCACILRCAHFGLCAFCAVRIRWSKTIGIPK